MSTLNDIWLTMVSEFSDIADIKEATVIVMRLGLAVILGAAIGYEREMKGKDAGLRTHMLVSLGAAIFVLVPSASGMQIADMSRVMQGVIAGVGFLGAGAILKQENDRVVKGLTTAASIWIVAAIGVAAGYGREATAVASTLIALFVLAVVNRFEKKISQNDMPAPRSVDQ
ncbi:MgtC/SapB family protein [Bordetella genomosp. 4]|uniref:MgtC/SapB family protein n=1 Tax=Bordetella genomosp. 4 TaxID=463044 RepID=UPI000B9DE015|nr:MgtC/SapB family protein [Bordetella genomosp. 4]OZI42398.1 methyltransferase [Bordetella genomosp. 4]